MKKEFVTWCRTFMKIMTVVSAFWLLCAVKTPIPTRTVQAAKEQTLQEQVFDKQAAGENRERVMRIPGKRLLKTVPLNAKTITQIPRYIVEENTGYVLDEASIVVTETGRSSAEGANVVTIVRKVEKLPDNDLERIEKSMVCEGIAYDLLYVIYEVTKEDEDVIPTEYSASCMYGGLEKYSESYPSAWEAEVWYDAYRVIGAPESITQYEEYEYSGRGPLKRQVKRIGEKKEKETEEIPPPKPEIKKFVLKKIRPGEEEEKKIPDFLIPLAAAGIGAGLLFSLMFCFSVLTAPLFALKKGERYRYIGQIRLKKEEAVYTAYLTERLAAKADIPIFKIKIPGRVRKQTKNGLLQVRCPDGKNIALVCGKEVGFTWERE